MARRTRCLVLQLMSAGLEEVRADVVDAIVDVVAPAGVLARNDVPLRKKEGLSLTSDLLFGEVPEVVDVVEHGVRYRAAPWQGQKTGAFLDQRENRALIGSRARGRALDCFSYHGSFALHLARKADTVIALDSSAAALERARDNAALNGLRNIEFLEANAFDFLKERERARERFDTIVLDPPAFAKTRASLPAGRVRLGGRPAVYLMPRHVGEEWRIVSDMARRLRGQAETGVTKRGKTLLLPVSMAQVWVLEIVFAGKLTRFERDSYGNWFRHLGQHNHEAGNVVHVADPEQARIIDAALRAFDATAVETRVGPAKGAQLARYGLDLPSLIVLVFSRDSSTPLAKLELGALSDSLDRYARLAPDGAVVTVTEFEMRRLTELLRAVGAAS